MKGQDCDWVGRCNCAAAQKAMAFLRKGGGTVGKRRGVELGVSVTACRAETVAPAAGTPVGSDAM